MVNIGCPALLADDDAHILELLGIGRFDQQVCGGEGNERQQANGNGERKHGCESFLATDSESDLVGARVAHLARFCSMNMSPR